MNTANTITLLRLALIPVFLVLLLLYQPDAGLEGLRIAAFAVFVTAAISDGVDGYIARHYNQRTRLGAVLDPFADKLLTNLSFVFLAALPSFDTRVPMWLPIVVLARDITIAGGSYMANKYMGPLRVRPRILGKAATVAHSVAIAAIVINLPGADRILFMTASISILSLVDYLLHGYELAVPGQSTQTGAA